MGYIKGFISAILLALGIIGTAVGFIIGMLSGVSIGYRNSNYGEKPKIPPYSDYRVWWRGGERKC